MFLSTFTQKEVRKIEIDVWIDIKREREREREGERYRDIETERLRRLFRRAKTLDLRRDVSTLKVTTSLLKVNLIYIYVSSACRFCRKDR